MEFGETEERQGKKIGLQEKIRDFDVRAELGILSTDDLAARREFFKELASINMAENVDLAQRAKIKWGIEGDENSKYFHSFLNQKRRQLAIRGVMVNGRWETNPGMVKRECFNFFSEKSKPFVRNRPRMLFAFSKILSGIRKGIWKERFQGRK